MRIVVLGTGPFAVPTFRWLLGSGHEIPALITRPTPPPRGREKAPLNPMRDAAQAAIAAGRALAIHEPESINTPDAIALLAELKPDLLMVCDYGQILSREALSVAPLGGINLHASLLPKYRGAAPIHWALLSGDERTGVSVIHMTPRLDGGPILAVRSVDIGSDETQPELEQRLSVLGVEAVAESIEKLATWDGAASLGAKQDKTQVSKAPRLSKADALVNWQHSARDIRNRVRALKPWPGVHTHWQRASGEPLRLILDRVSVVAPSEQQPASAQPGEVVISDGKRLVVATGDGWLSLDVVQPSGKRPMPIAELLRGYAIKVGDRLA